MSVEDFIIKAIEENSEKEELKEISLSIADLAKKGNFEIRFKLAKSLNISEEVLEVLSKDKDWRVQEAVAFNPKTPTKVLEKMLRNDAKRKYSCVEMIEGIALNQNTSDKVLEELSKDEDLFIRAFVMVNPNTPEEVLYQLQENYRKGEDEEGYVDIRPYLAYNPNANLQVLLELARRANISMKLELAQNINTPGEVLAELGKDKNAEVRIAVARNIKTPGAILEEMQEQEEESYGVLEEIADNPNTSAKTLKKLLQSTFSGSRRGGLRSGCCYDIRLKTVQRLNQMGW